MNADELTAIRGAASPDGNSQHEIFPLDEAAIATVAELRENIRAAQFAINAVLSYFARRHELKGRIQLSDSGHELIVYNNVPPGQGEPR